MNQSNTSHFKLEGALLRWWEGGGQLLIGNNICSQVDGLKQAEVGLIYTRQLTVCMQNG